ncbi:MAG: PDDEXK nuclease domain-containing protein [Eubacteriales bacterium]|nr:PDDEXK nuclease domain-containing protein [Eubacteriales bacterium]
MKKEERRREMKSKKKTVLASADYWQWIGELKKRYRATQIKAAVAVNSAIIEFYWNLGKDISEKYPGKKRSIDFFGKLSRDLREDGYGEKVSLSTANIRYAHRFYELYAPYFQQLAESNGKSVSAYLHQLAEWMTHVLNTPEDNPPVGMLICKDHNRVLAKLHLEELSLPMGITDYELKKVLPTQAQLAKCYADAEAQIAAFTSAVATKPTVKRSPKKVGVK